MDPKHPPVVAPPFAKMLAADVLQYSPEPEPEGDAEFEERESKEGRLVVESCLAARAKARGMASKQATSKGMKARAWSGGMLPCDTLVAILGHVSDAKLKQGCSRVSRAWREALTSQRAWSSTVIDNGGAGRNMRVGDVIELLRRHGSGMRSLSIADPSAVHKQDNYRTIITVKLVCKIAKYCSELHSLELRSCKQISRSTSAKIVALVQNIVAAHHGQKMKLLGCNLLSGEELARCGALVETMTSGKCNGDFCDPYGNGHPLTDFFQNPMVPLPPGAKLLRCTQGCDSGAMCTFCAYGEDEGIGLHCTQCDSTCCKDCFEHSKDFERAFEICSTCKKTLCSTCWDHDDEADPMWGSCMYCYKKWCKGCLSEDPLSTIQWRPTGSSNFSMTLAICSTCIIDEQLADYEEGGFRCAHCDEQDVRATAVPEKRTWIFRLIDICTGGYFAR